MAKLSRLNRSLDAGHTALVLFDALHGYLHPKDPEKAAFLERHEIVSNMQRLLEGARRAGLTVFYPAAAHAADDSDTVERLTDTDMDLQPLAGRNTQIKPRIFVGSRDARVADELAPADGDIVVPKH